MTSERPPGYGQSMDQEWITETIQAQGHEHVQGTHTSTFELTTDEYLTPAGDCIIGIEADRAPTDFDPGFIEACRDTATRIRCTLTINGNQTQIVGQGHPELTFASDRSLVARTSQYVDERTVMVNADRAAADLPREMITALTNGAVLTATLAVALGGTTE